MAPQPRQSQRPPNRRTSSSSGATMLRARSIALPPPPSALSSATAWARLRGKPSSTKPAAAAARPIRSARPPDPLSDHADDNLVGHEGARVHILLRGAAQLAAGRHRLAQHVAGREVEPAAALGEDPRLRALARARRAQQDQEQEGVLRRGTGGRAP